MEHYQEIIRVVTTPVAFATLILLIAASVWLLLAKNRALAKVHMGIILLLFLISIGLFIYFFTPNSSQGGEISVGYTHDTMPKIRVPPNEKNIFKDVEKALERSKRAKPPKNPVFSGFIKDAVTSRPVPNVSIIYKDQSLKSNLDGTFSGSFKLDESSDRIQIIFTAPNYQPSTYLFFREGQNQIILMQQL